MQQTARKGQTGQGSAKAAEIRPIGAWAKPVEWDNATLPVLMVGALYETPAFDREVDAEASLMALRGHMP